MQMWAWNPKVPMGPVGDVTLAGMIVKGIDENGGYLENSRLGWPAGGLQLYDLPIGDDALNLFLMRIISWFTSDFGVVMWTFMLLTFPLVAVGAYIVMRRLGVSRLPSLMVGLLYAFMQYHFRGQFFLLLIGYYVLPFALLLAFRVFQGVPLFARREGLTGVRSWLSRRTMATVATCVAIGSTGLYLAAFAAVVLIAAATVQVFSRPARRTAATAVVAIGLIVGTVVVNTSPSSLYRLQNGANHEVSARGEQESEVYGLTLTRMVLPNQFHRFGPAKEFGGHYQETTNLPLAGEDASYVGLVGTGGLVGLVVFAFASMTRGSSLARRRRYGPLAAVAGAAFVFGLVGGLNTIFSYLVHPVLRGTGRISIVIGFCAFAAVAFALDGLKVRFARNGVRAAAFPAVVVAITAVGLYDQTGTHLTPAWYQAVERKWDVDRRFVTRAEASVPFGTAVYTLPEQQFPESPGPFGLGDYDSAVGYLHSKNLKWSYGAVRNRQGRWLLQMARLGTRRKLEVASACGFGAVWVDLAGYPNLTVPTQLRSLTGVEPLTSEDGRREFYSLASFNQRETTRRSAGERTALCAEYLRAASAKIEQ